MALPITPPCPVSKNQSSCRVDCRRKEYIADGRVPGKPPVCFGFPNTQDLTIDEAHQRDEKRYYWQHSTLLDYGSYAYILVLDESSEYPIFKMSHDRDAVKNKAEQLIPPVLSVGHVIDLTVQPFLFGNKVEDHEYPEETASIRSSTNGAD
ncbi:hypothetical protein MMC28_008567 [Mycoblastus sanguinarius]|nr:hypothetical protein [Mycoblastus sanguinarius]